MSKEIEGLKVYDEGSFYENKHTPGDVFSDGEGGKIIVNKYGIPMHEMPLPLFDTYNDTRMILNPDPDEVNRITKAINDNNGYCPSKGKVYDVESLRPDDRCPCPGFIVHGKCECGLFIPKEIPHNNISLDTSMEEEEK